MTAKHWSAEAIEIALTAQGIGFAPQRGERLARAQQALLDAGAADPLRATLEFDADAPGFVLVLDKSKKR